MKTQRQSDRLDLRLDAEDATWCWLIGLEDALKTSVVPRRFCKSTTLLIAQVTWTSPA